MCKILIEFNSDGEIEKILTDRPMQIVIVDKRNIDNGISPVQTYEPEIIPGGESFKTSYSDVIDVQDQEIYDELKKFHL